MTEEKKVTLNPLQDITSMDNNTTLKLTGDKYKSYTCILAVIIVCIIILGCYYAYSCFCANQDIEESYINKQPRTDQPGDKAFDVDAEIKKLIQLQEQYLAKLQKSRLGN